MNLSIVMLATSNNREAVCTILYAQDMTNVIQHLTATIKQFIDNNP